MIDLFADPPDWDDDSGQGVLEHLARPRAEPAAGGAAGLGPDVASGRDNGATSYAASMVRRGFTRPEAQSAMRAYWETFHQPPGDHFPLDSALAKLDSAFAKFEPREVGLAVQGDFRIELPGAPAAGLDGSVPPPAVPAVEFLDWKELFSRPAPVIEWVIAPMILAAGRGHVVYSPTGIGKSLIMLEWAVRIALADTCVLYVDHENDPHGDVVARLLDMGYGPDDLQGLAYASFPAMAPLDTPAGGAALLELVERSGATFVVIDTASRTIVGPENDNDTWNAWDRNTGAELKRRGVGFVRLDHSGKDVERGARGGSAKETDVDLSWRLELLSELGAEPVEIGLVNEKSRVPGVKKGDRRAFRRVEEPLRHEVIKVPTKVDLNAERLRAIWEQFDSLHLEVNPAECPGGSGIGSMYPWLQKFGLRGRKENLHAVAHARWNSEHGYMDALGVFVKPPRPDWAPPLGGAPSAGWAIGS